MSSTVDFTEALQLTHSFDPSASQNARLDAERYLMDLRESAEGLNLSFHIISNEAVNEIRCFWAFNTIMHHLPMLATTVDATQANELYRTLFSFIHRYLFASPTVVPADFIVNKHAQMMVVGLQCFYPSPWSTIFDDLFEMLHRRQSSPYLPSADLVTVYVLRVFEYVDERVVCVRDRQERGKQQRARDMALKDAMREGVIPRAVDMWYTTLLSDARVRTPETAKLCLSVVQTYIEWVDVALFITADWINLLYFLLTVPPLRIAACECLLSLVEKKQMPGMKMESLRTLNVVDALSRMASLFELPPPSEEAVLFIEAVAKLTVAVAEQFLSLLETCSSTLNHETAAAAPVASIEVDGVVLQDRPFSVTSELLEGLSRALHAVVAQVILTLQLNLFDVRDALLGFLQVYLKSSFLLEAEAVELLSTLFRQTRIPGVGHDEDRIWDDAVIDQRKALHNLLRLLYRRHPDLVMNHLQRVLLTGLDRLTSSGAVPSMRNGVSATTAAAAASDSDDCDFSNPEVLEAALRYFYEIGESLRLEGLKDPNEVSTQLLQRLLTTEAVVSGDATCVHLAFFEVLGRYYLFFTYHQVYIPLLLQRLLLQPCGVMNSSDRVRARICYLFGYLLQVLKGQLGMYAPDMVNALHSIVTTAPQLQTSDRRELYEATGILLSICNEESSTAPPEETLVKESEALALLAAATAGRHPSTAVPDEVLAQTATLLGRKAELVRAVMNSAIDGMLRASASSRAAGSTSTVGGGMGGLMRASEHPVADAVSFLSALAKGLSSNSVGALPSAGADGAAAGGGGSGSHSGMASGRPSFGSTPHTPTLLAGGSNTSSVPGSSGNNHSSANGCGAPAAVSPTGIFLAQVFLHVTQRVMQVASEWAGNAAVRDTVGQYFHQLINTLPFDLLQPYVEQYVSVCLSWMEAVPELSKLLRLMFQYANKAGSRGVLSVARLTPLLWGRLCAVGELSEASPVVWMGVVSENARERVSVYKQFFTFLFSVSTWGCVAAFALMPPSCWVSVLRQLCYALTLPTELELPKSALQVLEKLTQEFDDSVASQAAALFATFGDGSTTIDSSSTDNGMHDSIAGVDAATAPRNLQAFTDCLLGEALPTAWSTLMDINFDLDDAKNFLLVGEVMQLFRLAVSRYGDAAMMVLYERIAPYVGDATARDCCTTIRDQPRVNAALKMEMKQLLRRVHEGQRQSQLGPSA
ncbi:exportin T (tRNA exportin)-like protein [Leptomonas pyrrhocoris]|uniref:Exportin-T n=1 Tax=Leptomonas pyrrhocoris TaxID=157538 RepID=A0A0N0DRL0_LEPPY|nr:exportin T (tRNA exportin)-like protein [Leptomonas pyrrhocoris]XP_015653280.1 exportin T (tRNA exportin)-like protein [Leptomonas pyrrhocoris]XP_015653281.1 exportin T (tRNA exportin)-like protein [Leptomonas pyrrhocoris]KPA74840.1 exportin T (tRNA exportin)-like protein [Leptomonas pyrrhocoris]KPA74841.1 exportin T (tRNA exportin)-like protein [Leptomonas pyrrhocoris]KPA74842.1 exportin T (tRNA exportin)-like protein [Leptomonas pyrrhocoris]|eukprot:XP_015653279.1 exportin T (tRNA exportin)-like protein [Leptomonas pyrrhocoris]